MKNLVDNEGPECKARFMEEIRKSLKKEAMKMLRKKRKSSICSSSFKRETLLKGTWAR